MHVGVETHRQRQTCTQNTFPFVQVNQITPAAYLTTPGLCCFRWKRWQNARHTHTQGISISLPESQRLSQSYQEPFTIITLLHYLKMGMMVRFWNSLWVQDIKGTLWSLPLNKHVFVCVSQPKTKCKQCNVKVQECGMCPTSMYLINLSHSTALVRGAFTASLSRN